MPVATYTVMGMLAFILLYAQAKNSSVRWVDLGFFSIQPSEFAKIVVLFWMASFYDSHEKNLESYTTVLYPLVIAGIIGLLIMMAPDLDTTVIYVLIVASIFFLAPMSKEIRSKLLLFFLGIGLIALIVIFSSGGSILTPSQQERLTSFHNPCSSEKYYTTGNQVCNGYIAINNGGLTGVGLGNSTQKYLYLPEAHTDFIFAIIMEELGLVGAGAIFVLYFLLIGRIIKIGKDSPNTRGFLICMGVASYIVLHIVVNLGGMFGLMPTTGVPLPFMSYGGSFCMCLVFALTAVQRINVENRMYKEKLKKAK
jgi:cell division protein FtsW